MRSIRYLLIPVIAVTVCSIACIPARAQLVPGLSASPGAHQPVFETAPVVIDGAPVFRVTALANPPPGATSIASRVFLIGGAIAQILAIDPDRNTTAYDPASFKIGVEPEGNEYALVATDDRHRNPLPIVTVTAEDARHNNMTSTELAQQWRALLQTALVAALERRQPAAIHRNTALLTRVAIGLLVLSAIALLLFRLLRNRIGAAAIACAIVLVWLGAITWGLLLFPATVSYGAFIVRCALRVALVWIGAVVLDVLLGIGIHQAARGWALVGVAPGEQARYLLRVPTMSKALGGFKRFLVFFIATLATLSALEIPIASVVTIGGIAALAIGFAAQTLVRDFLNGLLVLFEDQYVVGDYVMIGDYNGVVERLTLRMVQIRDSKGNLITIPHSTVSQVVNASRSWSRIDYRVSIDAGADVRKALEILRELLEGLKQDASWRDAVIMPFEWIGVEGMSRNGIVLRAVVRTAPLRQFDLRREINLRTFAAFANAGVALGNDPSAPFVTAPQASPDPS
jgi:moderate conductance mechanosensitive channel